MTQLRLSHVLSFSLLLAFSLALGCTSGRGTRGRIVDSGTVTDSGPRPDASDPDAGETDSGTSVPDSGGGVDTGTTTGEGERAVAGYGMFIEANCAAAHRCRSSVTTFIPEATDADFVDAFGNDSATCVRDAYSADGQAILRMSVDAGRILYDASSVGPCVAAVDGVSCEEFWTGTESNPACGAILEGTLPNGSACMINGECISVSCAGEICTDPEPA